MNGPPLARSGIDRASHRRTDPQWLAQAWKRARVLVVDRKGRALCTVADPAGGGAGLTLLAAAEAPDGPRFFLGVDPAGTPYFAVLAELPERPGAVATTLREVGAVLPDRDAGLFVTAVALANWHASHRYAPTTGEPTVADAGGWVLRDGNGGELYPRIDPAVIVLVHDGVPGPDGRCLLGRNAAWRGEDRPRFFSTLAGFVEPGESVEGAVFREVAEEVGVRVHGLRYEGSQAWPFPASLMLGFTAQADPTAPLRLDPDEIVEARWFTREEVSRLLEAGSVRDRTGPAGVTPEARGAVPDVQLPGPASIAHYLLRVWLSRG